MGAELGGWKRAATARSVGRLAYLRGSRAKGMPPTHLSQDFLNRETWLLKGGWRAIAQFPAPEVPFPELKAAISGVGEQFALCAPDQSIQRLLWNFSCSSPY